LTLADVMRSDVDDVFLDSEEHAETVAFHPVGRAPIEDILAVVELTETGMIIQGETGRFVELRGTVFLSSVAIGATNQVSAGDGLDIRGKRWNVERAEPDGFGLWTLGVLRTETVDRTSSDRYAPAYMEDG
jgi:hypothetical protein